MLRRYDKSLVIVIKHSYFLGYVFGFSGVGAVWVLTCLSLPYAIDWGLAAVILVSLARLLCLHVLGCARNAIRWIKLESSDVCTIAHDLNHPWQDCRVVGWFVHPWLVILRLQEDNARRPRAVLVAWDALPEDLFRELRVRVLGLRRPVEA